MNLFLGFLLFGGGAIFGILVFAFMFCSNKDDDYWDMIERRLANIENLEYKIRKMKAELKTDDKLTDFYTNDNMFICKKCGHELNSNNINYCPNCGRINNSIITDKQ